MIRRVLSLIALAVVVLGAPSGASAQDAMPDILAQDEVFSPPMTHLNPGTSLM